MAEFEHDGSALAAVRAFLAQHHDSSSEDEEPPEKYIPRPARLGVGANPNQAVHGGSTHGLSEVNRRLGHALRRQAQAAENNDEDNVQSSDDDEVESRARALGKRNKLDQKTDAKHAVEESRSRGKNSKNEQTTGVKGKDKEDSDSDDEWGDDILRRMTEEQDAQFQRWSKGFVSVEDGAANSNGNANNLGNGEKRHDADGMFRRKRKKRRSRQKNLKRDKRKRNELPAHLTEETLKAGRVRKSVDGKAEFHPSRTGARSKKARSLATNGTAVPMGSG